MSDEDIDRRIRELEAELFNGPPFSKEEEESLDKLSKLMLDKLFDIRDKDRKLG